MFTPDDLKTILLNNISELIFLAAIAVYGWVVRPIQKRRLEHSETTVKFMAQLIELMLADNHMAAIVYAKAQEERSRAYFLFIVAMGIYITSQIYTSLEYLVFTSLAPMSTLIMLVAIIFGFFGTRYLGRARVYESAILFYEKQKEIPEYPAHPGSFF